jgi:YD repeat-containing protein
MLRLQEHVSHPGISTKKLQIRVFSCKKTPEFAAFSSVTDDNNKATYEYDKLDRVKTITYAGGAIIT